MISNTEGCAFVELGRRELLERLAGRSPQLPLNFTAEQNRVRNPSKGACLAVLRRAPSGEEFLAAVCVNDAELKDFVAWLATYANAGRFASSIIRVVPWEVWLSYTAASERLFDLKDSILFGCILGEVAMSGESSPELRDYASDDILRGTASFVVARAIANGLPGAYWRHSVMRWRMVRRALGVANAGDVHPELLWLTLEREFVGGDLREIEGVDRDDMLSISRVVSDVIRTGDVIGAFERFSGAAIEGNGDDSLEKRFKHVRQIVNEERVFRKVGAMSSVAAGLCATYLTPERVSFGGAVGEVCREYPGSILWYGLFAATCLGSSARDANRMDFLWLRKEIMNVEQIIDPPRCDCQFEELMMRAEAGQSMSQYTTGRIAVDLFPAITTVCRPQESKPSERSGISPELFELSRTLRNAHKLLEDMIRTEGSRNPRQRRG